MIPFLILFSENKDKKNRRRGIFLVSSFWSKILKNEYSQHPEVLNARVQLLLLIP